MNDSLQILVDEDVTVESASGYAEKVLAWMLSNGVVATTAMTNARAMEWATERGLTLDEVVGWPPGPGYAEWVDDPDPEFTRMTADNWFSFEVGRQVQAVDGDGGTDPQCPSGHTGDGDAAATKVAEWFEGADPSLRCPSCDRDYPIAEWDLGPSMCLGYLSFSFENWGALSEGLVRELVELLTPHKTKLIVGTNL